LKLKRVPIDSWSVREKLALASAVLRSGDQNWMSVSRALRLFGEPARPVDWFSQKSCALQYGNLLENVDTPKRKKRTDKSGSEHVETPGESIMRNLTLERINELKRLMNEERTTYLKLKEEIAQIKAGQADDKLLEMCQQIDEEEKQKERDAEAHKRWLLERQEKKIELERAWKPPVTPASPHRKKLVRGPGSNRRNSSQSEPSSEADSPMSEPLNIDVVDEATETTPAETKPVVPTTPTSPLLTSLLKSPSPAPSVQTSILHSAITSGHHRVASSSPTIASLLNSSPGIPATVAPPPATVSSSLKNLVTSAIGAAAAEEIPKPASTSPAAGAPTLSMLLELPPSLPGKPLPELPVTKLTTTTKAAGEVCHPQHQEMRMGREVNSDEPVDVVEVDTAPPRQIVKNLEFIKLILEIAINSRDTEPEVTVKPLQDSKLIDAEELEVVTQVIEMEEEQEAKLSSEAETKEKPPEDMKLVVLEEPAPDPAEVVEVPAQNDLDIIIVDNSTLGGQEECHVVEIVNSPEQTKPPPASEIDTFPNTNEVIKMAENGNTKRKISINTGGKTWKEEEFEEKEKTVVTDEKPQPDKNCVTPKAAVRAETPSTEDDKTNDAAEPPRSSANRRRVTTADSVPNSPAAPLTGGNGAHVWLEKHKID
ncbi:hypothetical protein L9F63_008862, partial [Diploptera punctata]